MKKEKSHEGKLEHPSLKGVKDGLDLKSKLGKKFIQEEKKERSSLGKR